MGQRESDRPTVPAPATPGDSQQGARPPTRRPGERDEDDTRPQIILPEVRRDPPVKRGRLPTGVPKRPRDIVEIPAPARDDPRRR